MGKTRITFYGHFSGWSSYPTVCRAIARWLASRPGVELTICNLRDDVEYEGVEGLARMPEPERLNILHRGDVWGRGFMEPETRTAPGVGLLFGFPAWLWAVPRHEWTVGYHVGDTDRIPVPWVQAMNARADVVLTPSTWCKLAFSRSGVTRPVHVVPHGIDPDVFRPAPDVAVERFVVMRHFCSDGGEQRKGTHELVEALSLPQPDALAELDAYMILHSSSSNLQRRSAHLSRLRVVSGEPGPPDRMRRTLYGTSLLVQPSRGEGFGICPLEALAAGVPIVATACSGHTEFLREGTPGLVRVPHGPLAACSDGTGRAPQVEPSAILGAIREARRGLRELTRAAVAASEDVRARWAWPSVLSSSGLLQLLRVQ